MSQQSHFNRGQGQANASWQSGSGPDITNDFKEEWIREAINVKCIEFAEKFGKKLADEKFTTSQIRNVYGEIKRIQMKGFTDNKTSFLLLLPKMAYAAKRAADKDRSQGATLFEKVIKQAHQAVKADDSESEKRFKNFCDFAEAILAYHKASGGRD